MKPDTDAKPISGGPTGDQVEEIYGAIARLQRLYDRVRHAGVESAEDLPEHLRAVLKKLQEIGRS